jgi:aminoglycoside phosphotransferase (APT) family kinase protein
VSRGASSAAAWPAAPLRLRRPLRALEARRLRALTPAIRELLIDAGEDARTWCAGAPRITETAVVVVALADGAKERRAVAKIALDERAASRLRAEATAVAALESDRRLAEVHPLLPTTLAAGEAEGQYALVQRSLPGLPATTSARLAKGEVVISEAARTIGILHRATAYLPRDVPYEWIRGPLARIAQHGDRAKQVASSLAGAAAWADRVLGSGVLNGSRVHGDYWPGNLLVAGDASRLLGIVDWEQSNARGLAAADLLHLLLYARKLRSRRELGSVIIDVLRGAPWTLAEQRVLAEATPALLRPEVARPALFAYWCGHVASNLDQSPAYSASRRWMTSNVTAVAGAFAAVASG